MFTVPSFRMDPTNVGLYWGALSIVCSARFEKYRVGQLDVGKVYCDTATRDDAQSRH